MFKISLFSTHLEIRMNKKERLQKRFAQYVRLQKVEKELDQLHAKYTPHTRLF